MYCYVFDSLTNAQTALATIETRIWNIRIALGYTIDEEGNIIGKNASTGEDEPTKQRTYKWGNVIALDDGRYAGRTCRFKFPDDYETIESGLTFDYEDISVIFSNNSVHEDGSNRVMEDGSNRIMEQ